VETKVTDTANLGINTTVKVNPWVLGLGVGYRF
jgi:outer membrane protein W